MNRIDDTKFTGILSAQIEKAINEAAEPVIQAALQEAESKMRKALATQVLMLMNYSVERFGPDLIIKVKMPGATANDGEA